jgi:hypothetical protein
MEEHQNNTDTDVQDNQADSGDGAPKVIKAGSEAKAGRRVLRGGASDSGNPAEGSDHGATEAARSVLRAGQQALEGAGAATYAAVDSSNPAEGSDQATEAARSIVRAGQQTLEGAEATTHATVDAGESTGAGQVLGEWANFAERATLRNAQAVGDLMHCYTFSSLLQWQSNLLSATVVDWVGTNARILRLVMHKA